MDAQEDLDILDSKGNKTGKVRLKSDAHKLGLWHTGVHIWVYNSKGEVLLQKRSMEKENFPGYWDISAAGHVSAGEKPIDAALRELHEELGVRASSKDLKKVFVVKETSDYTANYHNREFAVVYIIKLDVSPNKLKLQKEEVVAVEFLSLKQFGKNLKNKRFAKRYVPGRYYPRIMVIIQNELDKA